MSRINLTSGTDDEWFYPRLLIAHESATITASGTDADYSANAIKTPLTYTGWKADALTATVELDFGSSKSVSYQAIYVRDIGASATITPQYWDGAAWQSYGSAVSITKKGPYAWMKLSGQSCTKVRLSITGTTPPVIAFYGAGAALKMPCGIPPGFVPASLNPEDEFTNEFSRGGQLLSAQKDSTIAKQQISMDGISPSWVDTNWPAVRALMNSNSMFFAFNPKDRADELIYGMRGKNAPSVSYSSTQYMALSFSIEGPEIEL